MSGSVWLGIEFRTDRDGEERFRLRLPSLYRLGPVDCKMDCAIAEDGAAP
jgi:hypothetical protein